MRPLHQLLEAYAAKTIRELAQAMRQRFPEILWAGDPASNLAALTFDDGPDPQDTPALLEVLGRHRVTATFSWLGERVEARPDLVRSAAEAGHGLMIHGYRHRSFLLERQEELRSMLDQTRSLLAAHSGREPDTISSVRPPFGHISSGLARAMIGWGYQPVICSVMPVHWMQPRAVTVRQTVGQVAGGSLVVLHESLGGPPVAELADAILAGLAGRGINFVTIDALWASHRAATR